MRFGSCASSALPPHITAMRARRHRDKERTIRRPSLGEIFRFRRSLIVGHELIHSRAAHLRLLVVVEKADGIVARPAADKSRSMGFSDRGILIGTIPCPVNRVGGNPLEIA